MFNLITFLLLLTSVDAGCLNSSLECLPGIDTVGVGFDAVKGSSFGVGRQVIDFSNQKGNEYLDPFGNGTHYAYPDQAQVQSRSTQFLGHSVYRSVDSYVKSQSINANVDASFGGFFSASVATQSAVSTMQDGLHIVAESNCELGLYSITLDPSSLLTPSSTFQDYISKLPETYDEDKYFQFIADYGTHYVVATTQGGLATMSTIISQEYYSQKSDSNIQAQLHTAWGKFGGGGGGGSSSTEFDAGWTSNAVSSTYTAGGDPSIKSFNSEDEWNAWAKSVTQGAPVVTSYTLDFLYALIPEGGIRDNVKNATFAYAAIYNTTFPVADPSTYQMDLCDCYHEIFPGQTVSCGNPDHESWRCQNLGCQKPGYVITNLVLNNYDSHVWAFRDDVARDITCCRPCFTNES